MADRGSRRAWRFAGLVQAVESDDAAMLDWLASFLEPGFQPTAAEATVVLRFIVDDARHDALSGAGPAGGAEPVGFGLDSGTAVLQPWRGTGTRVLRDAELDVFFEADDFEQGVAIIARAGALWSRLAAMRILRERAMAAVVAKGGILLHAAAVAREGEVVAIGGPKRAGKTTMLMHLLGSSRARLVANDRLAVLPEGDGWVAAALPTVVNIRAESLSHFATSIGQRMPPASWTVMSRAERGPAPAPSTPASDLVMSPAGLAESFQVGLAAGGPLRAILLPHAEPSGARLAPDAAAAALRALLFRADHACTIGSVFVPAAQHASRETIVARLDALARSVPVLPARLALATIAQHRDDGLLARALQGEAAERESVA